MEVNESRPTISKRLKILRNSVTYCRTIHTSSIRSDEKVGPEVTTVISTQRKTRMSLKEFVNLYNLAVDLYEAGKFDGGGLGAAMGFENEAYDIVYFVSRLVEKYSDPLPF